LDADDPELRVAAAVALKGVGHPGTAEALIRASFDEREEVREAAQAGLDELRTVDLLAGLAAVIGPMAERLEQLERAAGKRNASDLPDAPVPLLRRLLERRTRD
jgi:HEAT repeat protein